MSTNLDDLKKFKVQWKHQYRVRNHYLDLIVTNCEMFDPKEYAIKVAKEYGKRYLGLKDEQLNNLFAVKVADFNHEAVLDVNRLIDAETLKRLNNKK